MDDPNQCIRRSKWVRAFKHGFELGTQERKRPPGDRRDDINDVLGTQKRSDGQLAAMQAGYDTALESAVPGSGVGVDEKAGVEFDRSEHSPGLSQWEGDSDG